MSRHAGEFFRLKTALRGLGLHPPHRVAILLMETGALECVERQGDPRFIERKVVVKDDEIRRTLTSRYVRTDLIAQGGYRVYTLHEVISQDVAEVPTSADRVEGRGKRATGRECLRDELARLSDEERDDES